MRVLFFLMENKNSKIKRIIFKNEFEKIKNSIKKDTKERERKKREKIKKSV